MLHWKNDIGGNSTPSFPKAVQIGGNLPPEIADLMGVSVKFNRDAEIFEQDGPVTSVYAVVSGSVRFSRLMQDGRRQIGAFYIAGDLFGLESEDRHSFAAETIENSKIKVTKRSVLLEAAWRNPTLAHQIWLQTSAHLHRAQEHMFRLGRNSPQERIAAFILEMDQRFEAGGMVTLPMPRRDIADYLGLTIETVSRYLTLLKRSGAISIPDGRHILIRNRAALEEAGEDTLSHVDIADLRRVS